MPTTITFVALLRGVNVGGRNLVPMAELKELLSSLGYDDVVTYIRSGNVVFRATGTAEAIAARMEREIAAAFDVAPAVLLRSRSELQRVARASPFSNTSQVHVVFLDRAPAKGGIAKLDPNCSPPDEFSVAGREIYLHLPNGAGRSKLTIGYFERMLDVRGTQRNWNTLLKLIELSRR